MPWTKVDDSILDNAKLLDVMPAARWLYIAAIVFCRRNHTAGLLTLAQMGALLAAQRLAKRHVVELVKVGCLLDVEYGYEVHAYEEFNPLTSTERVRKHRRTRAPETAPPVSVTFQPVSETPLARASAPGQPVPVPQPVPEPVVISSPSNTGTHTREAMAICHAFEVLGGVITPQLLENAEGLAAEFRIPTADEFVAAVEEGTGTKAVRSVMYFRQRFRELNDSLRDAGRLPRDHDYGPRANGLASITTSKEAP